VIAVAEKNAGRSLSVDFEGDTLGYLHSFSPFGSQRNLIDASVYGEDDASYVLGLKDGTEVNGQILLGDSDHGENAIQTAYDDDPDAPVTWTATHVSTGTSFSVTSILTQITYESALDGLFAMNFTAKIVAPGVVPSAS
jgi:hypothetical protein